MTPGLPCFSEVVKVHLSFRFLPEASPAVPSSSSPLPSLSGRVLPKQCTQVNAIVDGV